MSVTNNTIIAQISIYCVRRGLCFYNLQVAETTRKIFLEKNQIKLA